MTDLRMMSDEELEKLEQMNEMQDFMDWDLYYKIRAEKFRRQQPAPAPVEADKIQQRLNDLKAYEGREFNTVVSYRYKAEQKEEAEEFVRRAKEAGYKASWEYTQSINLDARAWETVIDVEIKIDAKRG